MNIYKIGLWGTLEMHGLQGLNKSEVIAL